MQKMIKKYLDGNQLEIHNSKCPNCNKLYDMYEDEFLGQNKLQDGKTYVMAKCRCGVVWGVPK